MAGVTLGQGIYVSDIHGTVRLLAHDCRHVHQYEQRGSIAAFLPAYVQQIIAFGYTSACCRLMPVLTSGTLAATPVKREALHQQACTGLPLLGG